LSEQGQTYYEYVGKLLEVERKRTDRIDTRSSAVTTASATLVALGVGLVTILFGKDYKFESAVARWTVLLALAFLLAAATLALIAGLLRKQVVPDKATLTAALEDHWTDTETSARLACAWLDFDTLLSLRQANSKRTWWLDGSLRCQLVGAITLVVSIGWELSSKF
jgi:hypothetical protein